MENHRVDVQIKAKDEWVNIWTTGDWHIGSVGCDEDKLDKDIDLILGSEKPHVIDMGDLLDAICYRDKRFDPMTIHPRYRDHLGDIFRWQLKDVKPRINKLEPYIIGSHIGNHELSCSKYFQYNPHAELLETFPKIKDLMWAAITKITVNLRKIKLFDFTINSRHGLGEVKTLNSFQNKTADIKADIKIAGHNHLLKSEVGSMMKHRDDKPCGDVDGKRLFWGFTGGYLRTYPSGMIGYGEPKGFKPIPLGCLCIKVRLQPGSSDKLEFKADTT